MIKLSIVLVNFIGLFFFGVMNDTEIMIDHKTPTTIIQGEKQLVTVAVNKGDVSGFAKLELALPFGLTATPVETNGASFTFSGQKAKFIWMTLPVEGSYVVTYNIEASSEIKGSFEVTGVFSYINENQRVDMKIEPKSVVVEAPSAVASNNPAPAASSTDSAVAAAIPVASASVPEMTYTELTCLRTIQKLSDREFVVNLKLVNNNIKGFAKIMEYLPADCKPEKMNDGGAVVTADKSTIKFVWFEIPNTSELEVSYKMTCLSAQSDIPTINGKLSFVENNSPKEVPVINAGVVASDPIVQNQPVEPKVTEPVKQEPKVEPKPEPVAEVKTDTKPPLKKGYASVPAPETGVTYKVQIMAAHRVVGKSYFNSTYGFNDSFDIENHEGWVKYTTGQFGEYKPARDKRESLRSSHTSLPGPFVTAYNNGERITVQEALLISKQQWYQ